MRSVISLITAIACLLHFGLGCCVHYAHSADGHTSEGSAALAHDDDHGHSHEHDHNVPVPGTPRESGDSHEGCDETDCTFLIAGKTTISPDLLSAALPFVTPAAVLAKADAAPDLWLRDTGGALQLPVRLHLLHQVLLI